MPYIEKEDRESLEHIFEYFSAIKPGDLNYVITRALIEYIKDNGLSYQSINDCIGALEGAKSEFYRRVAVPYENKKIKENGDVYPIDIAPEV